MVLARRSGLGAGPSCAGLALLSVLALAGLPGCGGGGGGDGGGPTTTGVVAFANVDGESAVPSVLSFGGNGTGSASVSKSATGEFNVTFTGAYAGVASRSDISVHTTVNDTDNWHVASASMDQGSANGTTIVVKVYVWSTNTNPNPLEDASFSVLVTLAGGLTANVAGFANVDAEAVVPVVLSFGGIETTATAVAKIGVGNFAVTFTGVFGGVANIDDFTALVTINDSDNFNVASASIDQGSGSPTTIVVRVFVWSTLTIPNVQEDASFSVLLLHGGGADVGISGFATIDGEAGVPFVTDVGGDETTGVSFVRNGAGDYTVTFTGTYTGVASAADVTVLAAIEDSDNFHVASASMDTGSANATTVVVRVFIWSTNTNPNPLQDARFSVVFTH